MTTALATQADNTNSESLIKPSNIQEQLLGKINDMRQKNLTAKQKKDIDEYEKQLVRGFGELSWKYFGVSKEQIQELTDPEIEALFSLVSKRANKTAICIRLLGLNLPIINWMFCLEFKSILFTKSVRKLNKILGNDFSTAQIIRRHWIKKT